jgi:hypothetical protein
LEFRNVINYFEAETRGCVFRRLHPFDVFQNLVPVQSVFVFLVYRLPREKAAV